MPNLLQLIKRAAVEAVEASSPTAIVFGTVTSISPIQINVEQRLNLKASHLVLTSLVKNNLAIGEKVVLLRQQGGQRFIVLDKYE